MATITQSNTDNFLTWQKVGGTVTLADLQANGLSRVNTPQNLAIDSSLVLTWDDKSNFETGVEIHRRSENETYFTEIGSVLENVETYTDTNVTTGVTYYYKIRAYYDDGIGRIKVGEFTNVVDEIAPI
jgi:hypothetical protein